MKRIFVCIGSLLAAFSLMTVTAFSQDTTTKEQDRQNRVQPRDSEIGQIDEKTTGANIRASQLIGMNIQNSQGKSVGEINDIVLDANTGRVRYAAVTYGGFLGLGDKMFAVPFEAFKWQQDPNHAEQHVMVLNVTQKQLEGSIGFDQSHWPDFADRKFTTELDTRYGIERRRDNRERRPGKVEVNRDGVKVDVD